MKLNKVLYQSNLGSPGIQLTLAIIKPHIVKAPHALQNIRDTIKKEGFYILQTKRTTLSKEEAEHFYGEHRGKFFFSRLVTFMCSGYVDVHILARNNAIQCWRQLMGPTKVFQAIFTHPESIRGFHGLSDTRNATHGSDSEASALKEINFFFPHLNINEWTAQKVQAIEAGKLAFNESDFEHYIHG